VKKFEPIHIIRSLPGCLLIICLSRAALPAQGLYRESRAPLLKEHFIKLPVTAFTPGGWLLRQMELQRDGLMGHLGEISLWLSKKDNAWLSKEGKGKWGWEELPYWLKGYANTGYILKDEKMIREAKFWINAVLSNQRENGDFGPLRENNGNRDLWMNMPMLWCLQSYYEYSADPRVLSFMRKYFKWELSIPDEHFLEDYWEKSRGGDNLTSVYWLYNRTGEKWLLELATKIDRNTADWRQKDNLPNWHNVNIVQSFREPATYYLQSHNKADLDASYRDFALVRERYGQVPGGLFGADENARKGYDDPRQAVETCGMVEQMTSDQFLLRSTGDTRWAENCEDIAFNTFPAAFMPDYRSLRYLTAPNMVISDSRNHAPGIENGGPFLMMNPFSSRCCQHNHGAGWVYYAENAWMATPDSGLAAQLYTEGVIRARVGKGEMVSITAKTHYPFDPTVELTISAKVSSSFPLYLRVPSWCGEAAVTVNGAAQPVSGVSGGYIRLRRVWKNGDRIQLLLPMHLAVRQWTKNKNSVSISYGALGFSLRIAERYVQKDSKETAIGDSRWQETADAGKWPSYEIYPASSWNYGLLLNSLHPESSFKVEHKSWPADNNPFVNAAAPIELVARGRQIPSWTTDQYELCGLLPQSPAVGEGPAETLTLVPMGGARLRISAFPVVEEGSAAAPLINPLLSSGPDPYSCYKDGFYYYTHTMGNRIELWKTKNIAALGTAVHKTIFAPPPGMPYSKEVWAPEVIFIKGKWYAYFAADAKDNNGHRMWVLENASADPFEGEWVLKGKVATPSDKWAIDGDAFSYRGEWYFVWSGWEGDTNHSQNIYIAKMKNPWTLEGERSMISSPSYGWEKFGDLNDPKGPSHIDVNEGPQGLVHGEDLFVVYSGSACWTDTYALGLLRLAPGGDPLDPKAWSKSEKPVFQQFPENGVYATGHNSFFLSPDGRESWILYHANSKPGQGCGRLRSPHAQPFTWNADGNPEFGKPVKEGVSIPAPSGSQ